MLLQVETLTKTFATTESTVRVLDGVNLSLCAGTSLALTGESGSGKSTLLHLIAGLDTPDGGRIIIDGKNIATLTDAKRAWLRRKKVSVIFQQFNLIPSLNVGANISFQARLAEREDREWQQHLTEKLGLSDLVRRYPEQLSGGQQQRVAIARALAGRPALVLADEPTGNLDQDTGDAVLSLMQELVQTANAALLMVTHSDRLARQLDQRLHLCKGRVK